MLHSQSMSCRSDKPSDSFMAYSLLIHHLISKVAFVVYPKKRISTRIETGNIYSVENSVFKVPTEEPIPAVLRPHIVSARTFQSTCSPRRKRLRDVIRSSRVYLKVLLLYLSLYPDPCWTVLTHLCHRNIPETFPLSDPRAMWLGTSTMRSSCEHLTHHLGILRRPLES